MTETPPDLVDEFGVIRDAKIVRVRLRFRLPCTQTSKRQVGAVGPEVAACNTIDIGQMAGDGLAPKVGDLRTLRSDSDSHAERCKQTVGPWPGRNAHC